MSLTKHSKPVRAIASVLFVPKVIASLPGAAIESIREFKEDVKDEMNQREMLANAVPSEKE